MFSLPDPLHPAVVHFPIVLLLVGAGAAVVSALGWRCRLSWTAAFLLVIGAVGAAVAVETGESARELVGMLSGKAAELVDSHQEWAEKTEISAVIAAVIAVLAAAMERVPAGWKTRFGGDAAGHALRILTALAALVACYAVYQTGWRGGELVYAHGVGINATSE